MFKVPAVFLLSLALAGCAAGPQARLASDPAFTPARCAWDGTGQDPNQPQAQTSHRARTAARSDTDKSVATLQPYSTERWQAQDGIEADQDAQVKRSLAICKGCLPPQASEDARLAKAAD
jgi:hypothetical protein